MEIEAISLELNRLSKLVDTGDFEEAWNDTYSLYQETAKRKVKNNLYFLIMSNVASIFIDIGHMWGSVDSSKKGLEILEEYKGEIIDQIGEGAYYYNLSNGKSNLIPDKNPFNNDFSKIEKLIEIKSDLWKAVKLSNSNSGVPNEPTYIVNLGNSLKQQFRISEALAYYDVVNSLDLDVPQSWINRSDTLMMLNKVSSTYSIQMLHQIKEGFEKILLSNQIPPQWIQYYKDQVDLHKNRIDEAVNEAGIVPDLHDKKTTQKEYNELSDFRKFCLDNNLSLSEHGLYCACAGSARDNLTIPTITGVVGNFVIPMEMVLNRLKSEFSFSRRLYFEYINNERDNELLHESCFSDLFTDELLGLDVEKLRTAFRLCFGILDKIGVAICQLFDLYPPNGNVSFQSFWQLDRDSRREKFNRHRNPGLLALYSIATDLNDKKGGEWSFLKQLRNDLEHEFVVVYKSEKPSDIYSSYDFTKDMVFIKEAELVEHLKHILQLTRSAIFSFVFSVRDKAISEKKDDALYNSNNIQRKNYL